MLEPVANYLLWATASHNLLRTTQNACSARLLAALTCTTKQFFQLIKNFVLLLALLHFQHSNRASVLPGIVRFSSGVKFTPTSRLHQMPVISFHNEKASGFQWKIAAIFSCQGASY